MFDFFEEWSRYDVLGLFISLETSGYEFEVGRKT